jgi:hypothetical protein
MIGAQIKFGSREVSSQNMCWGDFRVEIVKGKDLWCSLDLFRGKIGTGKWMCLVQAPRERHGPSLAVEPMRKPIGLRTSPDGSGLLWTQSVRSKGNSQH